jgi:hypothetical protein
MNIIKKEEIILLKKKSNNIENINKIGKKKIEIKLTNTIKKQEKTILI